MMKLDDVGEVIATRDLILDENKKVTILFGKPQYHPEPVGWICPYQKLGLGSEDVCYAAGGDSVDAVILALSIIGAKLYCSAEYEAGRLSWDGGAVKGDLGFPVPPSIQDLLPNGASGTGSDAKQKPTA